MINKEQNIPVVVLSYSQNVGLWKRISNNLRTHFDERVDIFLITDVINIESGLAQELKSLGVKFIFCKESDWRLMVLEGVENLLDLGILRALFTFDDLFVTGLDMCKLRHAWTLADDMRFDSLKLAHVFHRNYSEDGIFRRDNGNQRYLTTLVFNIWSLVKLIPVLKHTKGPWDFEVNGHLHAENLKVYSLSTKVIEYSNLIVKGRQVWFTKTIDGFPRMTFSEFMLYSGKRLVLRLLRSIQFN